MPDRFEQPEAVWLVQEPTTNPLQSEQPGQGAWTPHPLLILALLAGLAVLWRRRRPRSLADRAAHRLERWGGLSRDERHVIGAMARRIGAHPVALLISESAFVRAQRVTPAEEQPTAASLRQRLSFGA